MKKAVLIMENKGISVYINTEKKYVFTGFIDVDLEKMEKDSIVAIYSRLSEKMGLLVKKHSIRHFYAVFQFNKVIIDRIYCEKTYSRKKLIEILKLKDNKYDYIKNSVYYFDCIGRKSKGIYCYRFYAFDETILDFLKILSKNLKIKCTGIFFSMDLIERYLILEKIVDKFSTVIISREKDCVIYFLNDGKITGTSVFDSTDELRDVSDYIKDENRCLFIGKDNELSIYMKKKLLSDFNDSGCGQEDIISKKRIVSSLRNKNLINHYHENISGKLLKKATCAVLAIAVAKSILCYKDYRAIYSDYQNEKNNKSRSEREDISYRKKTGIKGQNPECVADIIYSVDNVKYIKSKDNVIEFEFEVDNSFDMNDLYDIEFPGNLILKNIRKSDNEEKNTMIINAIIRKGE